MPKINFMNYLQGAVTDVPIHLVPVNGLYTMSNVVTSYKKGAILKRLGYGQVSTTLQAGKDVTGLFNFRQTASTQKMLATVNDSGDDDTQLFYKTAAGAWTELTAAETAWANKANINVEMEGFIKYCFFVGHGATDGFIRPSSLTGTTFGTTNTVGGGADQMPNAKFIKRYRDRLYIANCDISGTAYPYRVYFSSVPAAGVITWTQATDFLDVDFSDPITGLGSNWDRLMIFTEFGAYMYNQNEFKQIWWRGTSNHRTIKNSGAYMIFADRDGVWISTGGRPENVSGKVEDFIKFSNMTNAFAEVVDEEYYLHIGSVTVNGLDYSNCRLVLNLPTMTWRVEELYDTATIFATFHNNGQDFLYMGADDGEVHLQSKYTDTTPIYADDGKDITSLFQTGGLDFGSPADIKKLNKLWAYSDRAQGLNLKARVIDRNTQALTEFKPLGQLKQYINEFPINPDTGNFLQIEGTETGVLPYWSLFGFTVDVDLDRPGQK